MSLTSSLLNLPLSKFNSLSISTPFVNGSLPLSLLKRPSVSPSPSSISFRPTIQAKKSMRGKVVCDTNDKTIAVEVMRLVPHPKYKKRVTKKKTYQVHDPDNKFKVGDFVQLEKCRPISKRKAFIASSMVGRMNPIPKVIPSVGRDLAMLLKWQEDLERERQSR